MTDDEATPLRVRQSARLVLIDDVKRILLFRAHDPAPLDPANPVTHYWYPPGGGLEPGESFVEAGLRELAEETGIEGVEIGPCLWLREKVLSLPDGRLLGHERFFVVYTRSTVVNTDGLHGYEAITTVGYRWWTLEELRTTDDVVFPQALAQLLEPVLRGQLPDEPLWIE